MTTPAGGEQKFRTDPILTLSQKISDTLSLGVIREPGEDKVAPTIASANFIGPLDHPGLQSFRHNVSSTTTDNAGTITGGHADVAIQANDDRSWSIGLSHGPDEIVLGGGASTVHVGGSATIQAGSGDALLKGGKGDLTFLGGSGASTVLGGQGATTFFGGSGTLVATGGRQGNDLFITGQGSETLTGGGADIPGHGHATFEIIKGQSTNVTIKDFAVSDKVEFDGYTSLEVSQAHLQSTAAGTILTLADNTKVTFVSMDLKTIK